MFQLPPLEFKKQIKCSIQEHGLNAVDQHLFQCVDCRIQVCPTCLQCHADHHTRDLGIVRGNCECKIEDVCQMVTSPISSLPAFQCNGCKKEIMVSLHVEVGPESLYYCDDCGNKRINEQPLSLFIVPFMSGLNWNKLGRRIHYVRKLGPRLSEDLLPADHRWGDTHWGYRCDLCAGMIRKVRYNCIDCQVDSNFCSDCWGDHDSNHALMCIARPLAIHSPYPLAIKGTQQTAEQEYQWNGHTISIDSVDTVSLNHVSPQEMLMVHQALVLGLGSLVDAPSTWPLVVNALAKLYESLHEYLNQQDTLTDLLIEDRKKTYIEIAETYFGSITMDMDRSLLKRRSLAQMVLTKVFQPKGLPNSCFYIKHGDKTLFVLQSRDPRYFYRINLAVGTKERVLRRFIQATEQERINSREE
ncbi:hypothetical protein EDD86DRAFT_204217 [Gorgonomyces haynaldii]|nr:hypothetical protein EDD86DRAFT_204217 [Gorgonomyces haynaldii]